MTIYVPDTPADRSLLRAVSRRDVAGVRAALNEGASPNAAQGVWSIPTCSALLKAVLAKGPASPEMVRVLLGAGARLASIDSAMGRIPLMEALHRADAPVVQEFVNFCGGESGLFRALDEEGVTAQALDRMVGRCLGHPALARLFFDLWDHTPVQKLPSPSEEVPGIPWPWCRAVRVRSIPQDVCSQIESRVPMPTPHALGREIWNAWLYHQVRLSSPPPALLPRCLEMTPDNWWLARPTLGPAAEGLIKPPVLLQAVASLGCPLSLRAGLAALARLPQGWAHPNAPSPDDMLLACVTRLASVRALFKALPHPPSDRAMDLALIKALSDDYDPHHRVGTAKFLLSQGAKPLLKGQGGDTALHAIARWKPRTLRHLENGIDLLLSAGARWDEPENEGGDTPWVVLSQHHPALASRMLEEAMQRRIPEDTAPCHSTRRPLPQRF